MIKHGYHGTTGIVYLLKEAKEQELATMYTAQCLWALTSGVYGLTGNKFNMPQYVELIHPETKKEEMNAQQIKDYILKRLLE